MEQQLINKVYISMVKIQELLADEAFDNAKKLEEKGDKESFNDAQNLKIAGNKLEAITFDMKSKYPHLFKEIDKK